jgi:hypothetical protein
MVSYAIRPSSYLFRTSARRQPSGKTDQWTVLSGEGHCASAMARMACIEQSRSVPLIGALAQLGERLICIQEVNGSIPLGSTINGSVAQVVRAHA